MNGFIYDYIILRPSVSIILLCSTLPLNLKLCGEKITDEDMLEKTFSTFHASNMLLSQQYRERQFTKYSELISCLLVAEQNNKLLLQNHQSRPAGASPFPEANVANYQSRRGRGRGRGSNRGRGYGRGYTWHRESQNTKNSGGESSRHNTGRPSKGKNGGGNQSNICYKCGMSNHWSRTCRNPKHLIEASQGINEKNGKNIETILIEDNVPFMLYFSYCDLCILKLLQCFILLLCINFYLFLFSEEICILAQVELLLVMNVW
ncbi:putative transcription factor interactor and regulator CCHC(Zn) family [Helianthus annuus]|nr:putative transcription factor interactor and regulator CCHC(Zn) family [Helianthus annuus]